MKQKYKWSKSIKRRNPLNEYIYICIILNTHLSILSLLLYTCIFHVMLYTAIPYGGKVWQMNGLVKRLLIVTNLDDFSLANIDDLQTFPLYR